MKQLLLIIHILLIGLSQSNDSNQNYTSARDLVASIGQMNLPSNLTTGLDDLTAVVDKVLPHILPKCPVTDAAYAVDYTHKYVTVSIPYLLERTKKLMQVFKGGYALYDLGEFPEQAYMGLFAGKSGLTCLEYLSFMRTMTKNADNDKSERHDDLVFDYYIRALKSGEITSHILPFAFHNFNRDFNGIFSEAMMNAAMSCGLFPCMSVCAPQVEYDNTKSGPYKGMLHDCIFHWSKLKQPTLITEYIVRKLREKLNNISDSTHIVHVFNRIHEFDGVKGTYEEISHVLNDPDNTLKYIVTRQREISGLCFSLSIDDEIKQAATRLNDKLCPREPKDLFMGELTRYLLLDYQTRALVDGFESRSKSHYSQIIRIALGLGGLSPDEMDYLKEIYALFHKYTGPAIPTSIELIKFYRRNNTHKANLVNIAITEKYPNDAYTEIKRVIELYYDRSAFPDEINGWCGIFSIFYRSVHEESQVFASINNSYSN